MAQLLKSVSVFEKDINGDIFAWSFPALSHQRVVRARTGLEAKEITASFHFSKFASLWEYYHRVPVKQDNLSRITGVTICLVAQNFSPTKYANLLSHMATLWLEKGSTIPVMQAYLSVFTTGSAGPFNIKTYNDKKDLVSPLKSIFTTFGIETIIIWVAMLLKKRVYVYSNDLQELMTATRAFPLIGAWHRQAWDILRPYVSSASADVELQDLQAAGVYVAGFTDGACVNQTSNYDVIVDFSSSSVTIADHAKADFRLTKFHQGNAQAFLKAAETSNDQQLIMVIAKKTKELLDTLKTLKTEHEDGEYITLPELQQRKLPHNMDVFLYNVAKAEGLTQQS